MKRESSDYCVRSTKRKLIYRSVSLPKLGPREPREFQGPKWGPKKHGSVPLNFDDDNLSRHNAIGASLLREPGYIEVNITSLDRVYFDDCTIFELKVIVDSS
jgi:hypothetical protein